MIIGPQFGDAICLRVAQAFETAAGGFPAPAGTPARLPGPPAPGSSAPGPSAKYAAATFFGTHIRQASSTSSVISAWSIALSLTCTQW